MTAAASERFWCCIDYDSARDIADRCETSPEVALAISIQVQAARSQGRPPDFKAMASFGRIPIEVVRRVAIALELSGGA